MISTSDSPDLSASLADAVMQKAHAAALPFRKIPASKKAEFLDAIADEIEAMGKTLIACASRETHLSEDRLLSERARTTAQLRSFAECVREGSWVDASIDTALPDRKPVPKPDLRKMLVPLGPVIVFGAANFPFAYSTAGGDTASALAAGCPVVVKGHPEHADTSELVAGAIHRAAKKTGMPPYVFQHVWGTGFTLSQALVMHPYTEAVGFTGSFAGGKALYDLAQKRPKPIPVFAEMGSVNPVFILPEALSMQTELVADQYVKSVTAGMGQFCTKPGLQIGFDNEVLGRYISLLGERISGTQPLDMLNPGIAANFYKRRTESLAQPGVQLEASAETGKSGSEGKPSLASVSAQTFVAQPLLHTEVFGPWSLIVRCQGQEDMLSVIAALPGQLTATLLGTEKDLEENPEILEALFRMAGRIILNGVPTGVEVCPSMVHGGPFPATTDARFTAVGLSAMKRFVRPLCLQNFPASLLPVELQDANPGHIMRMVNGRMER
jgi:alpha-ketoglutaric semialdehyde dehydrogenase